MFDSDVRREHFIRTGGKLSIVLIYFVLWSQGKEKLKFRNPTINGIYDGK